MAGPSWLAGTLAAMMIVIAVYCTGRLVASRRWQRQTEADADGLHAVMGVAMAGMLVPQLSPLPGSAWEAVFAGAAAWFGWQAARVRHGRAAGSWQCPYPVPHLVECGAMLYMLLALPGFQPRGPGTGMPMPGMSASAGAAGSFPALAVVLALFMIGYVVWTADQLSSMATAKAGITAGRGHLAARPMLAPRLAACHKIAMGIAMGYMLIVML